MTPEPVPLSCVCSKRFRLRYGKQVSVFSMASVTALAGYCLYRILTGKPPADDEETVD